MILSVILSFFIIQLGSAEHIVGPPNLKLLQCFEFKKNFWIVGHAFHTSSVQFKDECLRMCLTSSIRRAKCLSAMHVPNDDECVISDQNQVTKPDLFIENDSSGSFTVNFFRNICVDPPDSEGSNRFEARLQGFRGGEGMIEFSQIDGKTPQVMVVISGLKENAAYDVNFIPERLGKDGCQKAREVKGKQLMTVETDHTGMAVQPWKSLDFDIFDDDDVTDKLIIVIDKSSQVVVDCGTITRSNSSSSSSSSDINNNNHIVSSSLSFFSISGPILLMFSVFIFHF